MSCAARTKIREKCYFYIRWRGVNIVRIIHLGDQYNGLDLVVKQVERFPEPALENTMQYKALSPVVISMQNDHTRYSRYLSPVDEGYEHLLRLNLLGKYRSVPFASHLPDDFGFEFKLKGMAKSKLVIIKPFTPEQSKIRGFEFDFALTAPAEFHRLILSSGIGEKNSTGFGWVEIND